MIRPLLGLALVPWLIACGGELPAPRILELNPAKVKETAPSELALKLEAVLPGTLHYGRSAANADPAVKIYFGETKVAEAALDAAGAIRFPTPVMAPGTYDVTAELADGRRATAPAAFTLEPGDWPTAYTLDAISDQLSGTPFTLVVRAQGPNALAFQGVVTLGSLKGAIAPTTSNRFVNGVLSQQVTITGQGVGGYAVTVQDARGTTAQSNLFKLQ